MNNLEEVMIYVGMGMAFLMVCGVPVPVLVGGAVVIYSVLGLTNEINKG